MKLEISLAPEALFHIGSFPVTNSFLMMLAVTIFIAASAVVIARKLRPVPRGVQNFTEMIFLSAWDFINSILGDEKKTKKAFPLIFTLFIFILISNLVNFIPGQAALTLQEGEKMLPVFRGVMADYGMVLVLTLISVITIQVSGIIMCGPFGYLGKFITFKDPLKCFVGILELVGEVTKILSLSFRLFGNIFAGEVLMSVMLFLAPFFVPLPFMLLELLASVIQAFVFSMLTLVFIKMAGEMEGEH